MRTINKKAEIFGMSFGMIFSIILMIFFIAVAFIGIKAFLNYQKNIQIGLFIQDFQNEVNDAWNSERTVLIFNSTLPSGIEYVCMINYANQSRAANNNELSIYSKIKESGYSVSENLYFYAPTKDYDLKSATIKHIDLSQKNPVCFRVINGKVSIKIQKKIDNPLVEVYY